MRNRILFDGTPVPAIWQGGSQVTRSEIDVLAELWTSGVGLGIFALDTAELYGGGRSELIVGEVLRRVQRDGVFVATKVDARNLRYADVISACERSLKRMGTDYIDLYQIHWTSPVISLEETMSAMLALRRDGKIRRIGVCNCTLPKIKLCNELLSGELATVQMEYNLVNRACEREIFPYCCDQRIVPLAYSPLNDGGFHTRPILDVLSNKYEKTPQQITLNWVIRRYDVCAVVRTQSLAHSVENAQSSEWVMSNEDYARIDEEFREEIVKLKPSEISCRNTSFRTEGGGTAYQTREEAIENNRNMYPSPLELSTEVESTGELLKPLFVVSNNGGYELLNGNIRYWAWVLAFGMDTEVDCVIVKGE